MAPQDVETFESVMAAMSQNFDTPGAHLFDSWKDADLYRAIDLPENGEPGEAQDREIAEYIEELKRRAATRAAEAQRRYDLNCKYGIPLDPALPWS